MCPNIYDMKETKRALNSKLPAVYTILNMSSMVLK